MAPASTESVITLALWEPPDAGMCDCLLPRSVGCTGWCCCSHVVSSQSFSTTLSTSLYNSSLVACHLRQGGPGVRPCCMTMLCTDHCSLFLRKDAGQQGARLSCVNLPQCCLRESSRHWPAPQKLTCCPEGTVCSCTVRGAGATLHRPVAPEHSSPLFRAHAAQSSLKLRSDFSRRPGVVICTTGLTSERLGRTPV